MKICSISARNFRTLESFKIDLQPNYCAISGRNNAGKSTIIRVIEHFLNDGSNEPFFPGNDRTISFARDVTQWGKADEIEVALDIKVDKVNDSEIFFVVDTYGNNAFSEKEFVIVRLSQVISKDRLSKNSCLVDSVEIDGPGANEIFRKFKSSNTLVIHNSTNINKNIFYTRGSYTEILEAHFDEDDRARINEAQARLSNSLKKAAKQHRDKLEGLLGKLTEKFQVELSSLNSSRSTKWPLEIKLTDKNVAVPLNDWGSGTQNRTKILMSVLDAVGMRSSALDENRCTPVFLVEEPESFLHPSAQADFGRVLNSLAEELEIQIIATTHSPYMLNQNDPSSNYLIERRIYRNALRESNVRDTTGDQWMLPFAENLGVVPQEFDSWKQVFSDKSSKVLLVEGEIDKEYFDILKKKYSKLYTIPNDVEILPYNGKDSLKNTAILTFMISRLGKVFITFDKDAAGEIQSRLTAIGLIENKDFCSIGNDQDGAGCIEGLLPNSIKSKVYAENTDLVTALTSADSGARRSAKSNLKRKLLEQFANSDCGEDELAGYRTLIRKIEKGLG